MARVKHRTPVTAMRLTTEDKATIRELAAYLGWAARRDNRPRRFNATEAVRHAVYTMLGDFRKLDGRPW